MLWLDLPPVVIKVWWLFFLWLVLVLLSQDLSSPFVIIRFAIIRFARILVPKRNSVYIVHDQCAR